MSEKRFSFSGNDEFLPIREVGEIRYRYLKCEEVVNLLNTLSDENEKLKAKVKRLQDIATRTEAEKEEYADLYCKCENELIKNCRRSDG